MQTPLALEVENLEGLAPERASLYQLDEQTNRFRLNVDADPRKLLGALRNERDRADGAEREAATIKAERIAEIESAQRERDDARQQVESARAQLLEARIREQVSTVGLHAAAVADALRVARELFRVNEKGEVVAKDGSKLDLATWLQSTRQTSPHWHLAGYGSGATQSLPSTTTRADTISRRSFDGKSPQQKAALLHSGIKVTDH